MARLEKTEIKVRYFNHHTYKDYRNKTKRLTKAEMYTQLPDEFPAGSLESITIPGQTITIKELNERYEKGRPIPVE